MVWRTFGQGLNFTAQPVVIFNIHDYVSPMRLMKVIVVLGASCLMSCPGGSARRVRERSEPKIVKQSKIAHSCATAFDSVKYATEQNGGHFSKRAAFLVVVRPLYRSRSRRQERGGKESKAMIHEPCTRQFLFITSEITQNKKRWDRRKGEKERN